MAAERIKKPYGIIPEEPDVKPTGRYTTVEAARRLRLHRNTITKAYKAGLLRPIDPTAEKIRYSGRELRRYWNWKTANG